LATFSQDYFKPETSIKVLNKNRAVVLVELIDETRPYSGI